MNQGGGAMFLLDGGTGSQGGMGAYGRIDLILGGWGAFRIKLYARLSHKGRWMLLFTPGGEVGG